MPCREDSREDPSERSEPLVTVLQIVNMYTGYKERFSDPFGLGQRPVASYRTRRREERLENTLPFLDVSLCSSSEDSNEIGVLPAGKRWDRE